MRIGTEAENITGLRLHVDSCALYMYVNMQIYTIGYRTIATCCCVRVDEIVFVTATDRVITSDFFFSSYFVVKSARNYLKCSK